MLKELSVAWEEAAWANTVFPLADRGDSPARRPAEKELERPVRILPGTPKLERYRSSKLVNVYVERGRVHLAYNEYGRLREAVAIDALSEGDRVVRLEAAWLPKFAWRLTLVVDGTVAAHIENVAMLVGLAPFSGIDVGTNRGGPVHWDLYEPHGSFRYRGNLHAVTWTPGEHANYDPAVVLRPSSRRHSRSTEP